MNQPLHRNADILSAPLRSAGLHADRDRRGTIIV